MDLSIKSKLPETGTTIFTTMSSLASQVEAVNLGQGFPDYAMSDELISLVNQAMIDGFNQYVHMNGYMPLRVVIADKAHDLYGNVIDADTEITITPGGTYALYTSFTTILNKGDEVIIFEPAYDSYAPSIQLNGAVPVPVQLQYPEYKINWEQVRSKLTPRTKAIVLNSPHNPTGSVLSKDDIAALRSIVEGTEIFIISDEVYEHLIFDASHESMLRYPDLLARSFVCFSFGKVFNCTGWKLGYCIAPAQLMSEFRKIHQFNCFTCDTPKQVALAEFLKNKDTYIQLGETIKQKQRYFQEMMKQTRFKPLPTFGSYFQIYSYADISDENEFDFAVRLTKEAGVATIPVSSFYSDAVNHQVLRFCFAKRETTLEKAVDRLRSY